MHKYISICVRLLQICIGFLFILSALFFFPKEVAGQYFTDRSIALILSALGGQGLSIYILRSASTAEVGLNELFSYLARVNLFSLGCCAITGIMCLVFGLSGCEWILVLALLNQLLIQFSVIFRGKGRPIAADIPLLIVKPLILITVFALDSQIDFPHGLSLVAIESIVCLIVLLMYFIMDCHLAKMFSFSSFASGRNALQYLRANEIYSISTGVSQVVYKHIDTLLVGVLLGSLVAAEYKVVCLMVLPLQTVSIALYQFYARAIFRSCSEGNLDGLKQVLKELNRLSLVVRSILGGGIVLVICFCWPAVSRYFDFFNSWDLIIVVMLVFLAGLFGPVAGLLSGFLLDKQLFFVRLLIIVLGVLVWCMATIDVNIATLLYLFFFLQLLQSIFLYFLVKVKKSFDAFLY